MIICYVIDLCGCYIYACVKAFEHVNLFVDFFFYDLSCHDVEQEEVKC